MNNWQKKYCEGYYGGKAPKTKVGKIEFDLLGKVKDYVAVTLEDGRKNEYKVTLDDCDIPNGKISVEVLAANLRLWAFRGFKIETR